MAEAEPTAWWMIDRILMQRVPGLKPWECDRFTLAEIEMVLRDTSKHAPSGHPNMSDAEIARYNAWWNSLTLEERLQLEG
ncbi:MAG TPA: hypothetical protein VEA69_22930 [Tepidisphaeraceae bacterium]|nr:hypothetical protein [Tepidisphaeraceae bacterium]